MKEIRHILAAFDQIDFTRNKAALAMVARVEGSAYRRTGARMLVLDNGTYLGGISGGCLEGDALRRARKAIAANQVSVVTYDTTRDDYNQIGVGLGCNGIIDVLFMPLDPQDAANPVTRLRQLAYTREPRLLATITGSEMRPELLGKAFSFENTTQWQREFALPELAETTLSAVRQVLKNGETQTLSYTTTAGDAVRICFEVLVPAIHLVLFGSNHDIYPLVRIGRELGWEVTVVANPLKMDKALFSSGVPVISPQNTAALHIDRFTAIVLMSHDLITDLQRLPEALRSSAPYIGLLGPRKRAQKMFDALENEGQTLSTEMMDRIFAPAGLDIGALSPEEIALSMAAEIRAHFAGRPGQSLRLRAGAIHTATSAL